MQAYPYLVANLYFLILWLFFFFFRKNWKEQLIWSLVGIVLGPVSQIIVTRDWWQPAFVCPSCLIHLEDIILGFTLCGISGVLYNDLFVKKQTPERLRKITFLQIIFFLIVIVAALDLAFIPHLIWGVHSFWTSTISLMFLALVVALSRPDLIKSMFVSGFLLMVLAAPFYLIGLNLNSRWIQEEWVWRNLSGVYIFKVPLEDWLWYFVIGFSFSAFWELVARVRYRR